MNIYLIIAAALSLGITAILGIWLIPYLRKLKYGQTILDIGPNWHKNKQGTPTMGGIMFIAGVTAAVAAAFCAAVMNDPTLNEGYNKILNTRLISGLLMALGYALIGFADDFVKVTKKQNLGLTAKQKLVVQFAVAALYMWSLVAAGDTSTTLIIPFIGQWDIGVLYYPLCVIAIAYIVNSVNLTDGLDGLAASVTFMACIGFIMAASVLGFFQISLMGCAVAGGCVGFLIYNFYPAKVFMGDTGSMFLGGCVVAMAFGIGMPLILAFTGIIYICESMSVVLQVISFKTTGKRIFKMSPIHHHFEMSGYNEIQIVFAFSFITLIGSLLAFFAARNVI